MGRRTWNYSVGIKVTKYKEYLKMMLGTHLGFLVFLLVYAFIENCVGWMMGTYHSETIPPYNMSGLLLMALDVFMAYLIGFFEEFSFSLYVSSSWKNMITSILLSAGSLVLMYMFAIESYRLLEYMFGREVSQRRICCWQCQRAWKKYPEVSVYGLLGKL